MAYACADGMVGEDTIGVNAELEGLVSTGPKFSSQLAKTINSVPQKTVNLKIFLPLLFAPAP